MSNMNYLSGKSLSLRKHASGNSAVGLTSPIYVKDSNSVAQDVLCAFVKDSNGEPLICLKQKHPTKRAGCFRSTDLISLNLTPHRQVQRQVQRQPFQDQPQKPLLVAFELVG